MSADEAAAQAVSPVSNDPIGPCEMQCSPVVDLASAMCSKASTNSKLLPPGLETRNALSCSSIVLSPSLARSWRGSMPGVPSVWSIVEAESSA